MTSHIFYQVMDQTKFLVYRIYVFLRYQLLSDTYYVRSQFKKNHGYVLDTEKPRSLNEKINWLKLHWSHPRETEYADKFAVRDFVSRNFGYDLLVPIHMHTVDVNDLIFDSLPDYPFIIKTNHDSGSYIIVRDKNLHDWNEVRRFFRFRMKLNYFWFSRERQYKNIAPRIIVERLLIDDYGRIPNDYKLHCFNGRVKFIYVSIDREGENFRQIYSRNWTRCDFEWLPKYQLDNVPKYSKSIVAPVSFNRMLEIAEKIASEFVYVRVDFYDVNGKLFFGEITQHHGSGNYLIRPFSVDLELGSLLNLNSTCAFDELR